MDAGETMMAGGFHRGRSQQWTNLSLLEVIVEGELKLSQLHFRLRALRVFIVLHVDLQLFKVRLDLGDITHD